MVAVRPRFLLFSEASTGQHAAYHWRFRLESLDGSRRLCATDAESEVSSQRLELLAVVRGLEALDQPSHVTLVTSSNYVIRGISRHLDQWRDADWQWERFGRIEPIRDVDLWRRVDRAMKYHFVDCRGWQTDEQLDGANESACTVVREKPVSDRAASTPCDSADMPAVVVIDRRSLRKSTESPLAAFWRKVDIAFAAARERVTGWFHAAAPLSGSA